MNFIDQVPHWKFNLAFAILFIYSIYLWKEEGNYYLLIFSIELPIFFWLFFGIGG